MHLKPRIAQQTNYQTQKKFNALLQLGQPWDAEQRLNEALE